MMLVLATLPLYLQSVMVSLRSFIDFPPRKGVEIEIYEASR